MFVSLYKGDPVDPIDLNFKSVIFLEFLFTWDWKKTAPCPKWSILDFFAKSHNTVELG